MSANRIIVVLLMMVSGMATAQTIAITGATIHTVGPAGTLENATVVLDGGLIKSVGTNVKIPADAVRIDARGKIITPGLFSPLGQIGLSEVGLDAGTNDSIQRGDLFTASFDVSSAYNRNSPVVAISRLGGITRAAITPQSSRPDQDGNRSHVLSGLGSVVQLGNGPDHLVRRGAVIVANLGNSGSDLAGGSRAAAVQTLRLALDDAMHFQRHSSKSRREKQQDYSLGNADLEALQSVLNRNAALMFDVNRASDIRIALQIAREYDIRVVIVGGSEAWMLADQIAEADVPLILDGLGNLPSNFDRINSRLDSASILANAGVKFTFGANRRIGSSPQTHGARRITQPAGIAVANGLTWAQALEAITLVPAQIYGVDKLVGSIEVGKEADLVVWSADPLELTSQVEQVYIQGTAVPMVSRQTLLRDRYLPTATVLPPALRHPYE